MDCGWRQGFVWEYAGTFNGVRRVRLWPNRRKQQVARSKRPTGCESIGKPQFFSPARWRRAMNGRPCLQRNRSRPSSALARFISSSASSSNNFASVTASLRALACNFSTSDACL